MEYFIDNVLEISVRNLVEFILRTGDIDNRGLGLTDAEAMLAGTKIHRKIQKSMGIDYQAEVPLKITYPKDKYIIVLEGRADGIVDNGKDIVMIDEIKGTYRDIKKLTEPISVHKAQAMCYGYMYGCKKPIDKLLIRMTYVNLDTEVTRYFDEEMEYEDLSKWFHKVIEKYCHWADYMFEHKMRLEATAKELTFPFEYRPGQRDIVVSVYKSINNKKELYIQAPTGVGKTMSVVYPAVKAIGEGKVHKVFYLTAKTITRTVAMQAYGLLREKGLDLKSITITAKDKICVMEERKCNPEYCPRAKGHFDRVNEAVFELINKESDITREIILGYAEKYNVCPFEMSLDVSNWVDGIVCDYNYAFDPNVALKRYFNEGGQGKYVLLVDEAHNLVDRAREMYSAVLIKENFLEAKRIVGAADEKLVKALERCNKAFLELKRATEGYVVSDNLGSLPLALGKVVSRYVSFFEDHKNHKDRERLLELYFDIRNFLNIYEYTDDNYRIYRAIDDRGDFFVKLLCINPSNNLQEYIDKTVSTIFFSATLLPVNYYKELFTGNIEDNAIYIASPFEQKKRLLIAARDVSSRYTRRQKSEFERIASYIREIARGRKGNYMVFFPSYRLMEQVYEEMGQDSGQLEIVLQASGMEEKAREEFLSSFDKPHEKTFVAFCVMGGIFSEGIDLTNDRLIGTIIVGTGLPQIGFERDIIKEYFSSKGRDGFDYAYRYPGMNKVLQAAGRVIRTREDVGVIGLLDERFEQRDYKSLFPLEWNDCRFITRDQLEESLKEFWNK